MGRHLLSCGKRFLQQNEYDILCFQEVCGQQTFVGNIACRNDCFQQLQQVLGATHEGILTKASTFTSSPTAYDGNAIFYRKEFLLKAQDIIWFNERTTPFPTTSQSYEDIGRNALCLTLERDGQQVKIISAHLPWARTKEEQPHQTKMNKNLITYIASLQKPWILAGDLNLAPYQPSVVALEKYGQNLTKVYRVKNTIDPTLHTRWEIFAPGEAIDYIFVSSDVQVKHFEVLQNIHMSDHFGLSAMLDI